MTMYLVDKSKRLLGSCVEYIDGWRFIPAVTSRKTSRKAWSSAVEAIPKWAFDVADDLLTLDEWMATQ